jgi:hypothetical protein
MKWSFSVSCYLSFLLIGLLGCSSEPVKGPNGQRGIVDGGLDDVGPAANLGLECEVDDDCESSERCKHFGEVSLCVLGCGSDDDCPSEQPTCELYGDGDGICIRRCRTDGMCGEGEVCESRSSGFGACVPEPPSGMVGFAGMQGSGGAEPGMKFQCASDANCPQGFTCEASEDGTRVCEPEQGTGGSAGSGGNEGGSAGGAGNEGGSAGNEGGSAGSGGNEGGSAGSEGGNAGSEGGNAGSGGGNAGSGGNEGGSAGSGGNEGGSAGSGGNEGGSAGGEGGAAGGEAGNPGTGGASGAGGNPLDQTDTTQRGYIHFSETKRGNLPAQMYGLARFANFTRMPVPVNEDDIWPDPLRVSAGEYNDGTPCFYFDGTDPETGASRRVRNVDVINVLSQSQDFSLAYQDFAESYSLNPDEVFNLFTDAPGTLQLTAQGSTRFGGFNVEVPSPGILTPSDVDLGASVSLAGQTVTWTPGNGDFVRINLRAGQESVECDAPDTGSLFVSGAALSVLASNNVDVIVSRVIERGVLTDGPEGVVEIRFSSAVNLGNLPLTE